MFIRQRKLDCPARELNIQERKERREQLDPYCDKGAGLCAFRARQFPCFNPA